LFSDNQPTVSWVDRLASKNPVLTGQLVRALTLRMKKARVSRMIPLRIRGAEIHWQISRCDRLERSRNVTADQTAAC
jgi:hypothetical protein